MEIVKEIKKMIESLFEKLIYGNSQMLSSTFCPFIEPSNSSIYDILNQRKDITKGFFFWHITCLYILDTKGDISILVHPWRILSQPPYSTLKMLMVVR